MLYQNNKLLKKADAISGRAVNQELITELLEGNQLDDYPVMKNLWTQCIHKNDYTGLDEFRCNGNHGSGNAFIHVKYTGKFQGDFTDLEIHAGCVYRFMDIYRLSADKGIWTLSEYLSDGTGCMDDCSGCGIFDCKDVL